MKTVTCCAPVNIAVIKYWGKDKVGLNTPLNSSLSVTLQVDQLGTRTSVAGDSTLQRTRLWLNGDEQAVNTRVARVLHEMGQLAQRVRGEHSTPHVHIVSTNSFPTAAELASSAALRVSCGDVGRVLRPFDGSGGVSRSALGYCASGLGIGLQESGRRVRGLAQGRATRWPRLYRCSSRERDALASAVRRHLCGERCAERYKQHTWHADDQGYEPVAHAKHVVPDRIKTMEKAILTRDFETFGTLTMQDSNQFHSMCLDTMPPIFYLNNVSRQIIRLVHHYNQQVGCVQAAYTFDAGPNAVLFVEEQHVQEIVSLLHHCFSTSSEMVIKTSIPINSAPSDALLEQMQPKLEDGKTFKLPHVPNSVKLMYVSRVGGGTRVLSADETLVDALTGEPLPIPTKGSESPLPRDQMLRYLATAVATAAVLLRK